MTIERSLMGIVPSSSAVYIEDCFSCYLYTGTGASQTITNGIDLSTKGGLVWMKGRSGATDHALYDTARGATFDIGSNLTTGQTTQSTGLTAFGTTGFTIGALAKLNTSTATYASWTFRKQAKFFTIATWTGTGVARTISHDLGCVPGMIIVKRTDTTSDWAVYHSGQTSASHYTKLNLTDAQASDSTVWNGTAPTSSVFSVGTSALTNANTGTYVAYLFAASSSGGFGASGTDSVVACGSYTGNGSASGPTVTLGWEPQFVLIKQTTTASTTNWNMFDNMRGIPTGSADPYLFANTTAAEATTNGDLIDLTSTGFVLKSTNGEVNANTGTYIYLAIRRGPMKTPTDATTVFEPKVANVTSNTKITISLPYSDMAIWKEKGTAGANPTNGSRLAGGKFLDTSATAAEVNTTVVAWDANYAVGLSQYNVGGSNAIYNFRRAPGFMDCLCFTGNGTTNRYISHNLTVVPELVIIKRRGTTGNWWVDCKAVGSGKVAYLNTTAAVFDYTAFGTHTATQIQLETVANNDTNQNNGTYVAYLFASLAGVSKVGTYTGNGSSQTINCGFAAGARFVLIKRTDSTGDWFVFDSSRGIVSANDPHLSLNTTAAEVTTDDSIDPDNSGFIVNQVSGIDINVNTATYLYLAIA